MPIQAGLQYYLNCKGLALLFVVAIVVSPLRKRRSHDPLTRSRSLGVERTAPHIRVHHWGNWGNVHQFHQGSWPGGTKSPLLFFDFQLPVMAGMSVQVARRTLSDTFFFICATLPARLDTLQHRVSQDRTRNPLTSAHYCS